MEFAGGVAEGNGEERGAVSGDRERRLAEIARWVADTCVLMGAGAETAHGVARLFVAGLRKEWEKRDAVPPGGKA